MLFQGFAGDNLPNRNGGRFSLIELQRISNLLPRCPLTFDHSDRYHNRLGTILSARLEQASPPPGLDDIGQAIVAREGYWHISFEAEFTGETDDLPSPGDGISLSVLYKTERCPDCDCEAESWVQCPRPIEDVFAKGYIERVGVADVLELSLVLIPAVKHAAVNMIQNTETETPTETIAKAPLVTSDQVSSNSNPISMKISHDIVSADSPAIPQKSAPPAADDSPLEQTLDTAAASPTPSGVVLTSDELNQIQQQQIEFRIQFESLQTQLQETQKALQQAQQESEENKIKASIGLAMPGVNLSGATSPDKLLQRGRLGEWSSIYDSAPYKDVSFDNHTMVRRQRDTTEIFRYWVKNRDSLRRECESLAKASGFLMGSYDAATARSDIPVMLLEYLSSAIRVSHQTRRIFWQFPKMVDDFTSGPGDIVRISRWAFLPEPTAKSDFTLTPGTSLSTTPQNISNLDRTFTVEEIGSGKSGISNMAPVGIPEFWIARSIEDLESRVVILLGQNYEASLDMLIRTQYQTATTILYNDNGAVTSTPGDVGTGDDGTFTQDFLHSVYARMSADQVVPLADGNYVAALNTYSASQLRKSLGEQVRYQDPMQIEALTNLLKETGEQGQVVNYMGSYCNFHVFTTNVYGIGAAGTEGAQNVTLGTGSKLTRSSWVFGRDAVGLGQAMAPSIFRNTNDDYGRMSMWVWRAHMACGTLDVDPNNDASEQLRVYELRCTDVAQ